MSIPVRVVLASDDLMARARVLEALEVRSVVATTDPTGFSEAVEGAAALILDLDRGGAACLEELAALQRSGRAPEVVVGFFSHVDAALGRAAREAGCRALPRGKFWAELPALLGERPTDPS